MFAVTDRFARWDLTERDLLDLAALLNGGSVTLRDKRGHILPETDGVFAVFPAGMEARKSLRRVLDAEGLYDCAWTFALYCYADIVLSHPLNDGNGRLARATFIGALIRRGVIVTPGLPLGLAGYLCRPALSSALRRLGTSGDWSGYARFMRRLVQLAELLARQDAIKLAQMSISEPAGP